MKLFNLILRNEHNNEFELLAECVEFKDKSVCAHWLSIPQRDVFWDSMEDFEKASLINNRQLIIYFEGEPNYKKYSWI